MADVGGPLLKGAGNGWEASENAVRADTLHLVPVDRATRLPLSPAHDRLAAELVARAHLHRIHALWHRPARVRARAATCLEPVASTCLRAAVFRGLARQLKKVREEEWRNLHCRGLC